MKIGSVYVSVVFLVAVIGAMICPGSAAAQDKDPWSSAQLIAPATLAEMLKGPASDRPVVLDVGPAGVIAGAREVGPAHQDEGMKKLKQALSAVPRDKEVVVYCGCCPFAKCPNVRPAFRLLLEMGFKTPRLLDLPHNLKKDWIDKGYPLARE